jgi:hypothetical protein
MEKKISTQPVWGCFDNDIDLDVADESLVESHVLDYIVMKFSFIKQNRLNAVVAILQRALKGE